MAIEEFNTVSEGANWGQVQRRFNKTASEANAVQLKGAIYEGCEGYKEEINLTYAVASAGDQVTFTQNTALSNQVYSYAITLNDTQGNFVTAQLDKTAITTPVIADTSALDASKDWKVIATVIASNPISTEGECHNEFIFDIASPANNPTATVDTREEAGVLSVSVNDTVVASAGSIALGTFAVDDIVIAKIALNETSGNILTISNFTASGDGSFALVSQPSLPLKVAPNGLLDAFRIQGDTSTVGAKTVSLSVVSDDAASPYTLDITFTVA